MWSGMRMKTRIRLKKRLNWMMNLIGMITGGMKMMSNFMV